MKNTLLLAGLLLAGCATPHGPSLAPIRNDLASAKSSNAETEKHLDTADYKATRALLFFP